MLQRAFGEVMGEIGDATIGVGDPAYRASGAAFASTQAVGRHRVADVARLQAVRNATARLTVTARYEHLIAREALARAGYANSDFPALWAVSVFEDDNEP